ncbi:class I SAM-dependent methyltransferase [Ornithinimicrobium ciconiae]|uniref:Class I SAM-dependent methyltransferase n=1 Tax=Ornithinimicrobium ciconiae TaxID=2594265 RepID=A0A516G8F1_9MICO|nr:class I SAM-dependent methyltransferase [Ornithinimicrobium ciconiae]QDO87640.1 class I SAM-dependent methyltransferase [Ornithinimicrobium ciconiae]
MAGARGNKQPVGTITRGTTNPNRLRRVDRWTVHTYGPLLRAAAPSPVVVDLGYGAHPVTTLELRDRLAVVRPDVVVVGLEIDEERVRAAQPHADPPGLSFARGGFEIPLHGLPAPLLVRAFNVLRQYDEGQVAQAWSRIVGRLAPGGALVEGTCNEVGRLGSWVDVRAVDGQPQPRSLTLSWRLRDIEAPSVVAERLPKALIHRNVPGERVHELMVALDTAWSRAAGHAPYGARQRFLATVEDLIGQGWPMLGNRQRWRLGELEVAWAAVAPRP